MTARLYALWCSSFLAPGATATVRPRLVLNVFDTAAAYTTARTLPYQGAHPVFD